MIKILIADDHAIIRRGFKQMVADQSDMMAVGEAQKAGADRPPHEALTDREFQVLRQLGSGKSVSQVADQLLLSVKTISTYRAHLLEKMHLRNTAELMRYAICNGLVD